MPWTVFKLVLFQNVLSKILKIYPKYLILLLLLLHVLLLL